MQRSVLYRQNLHIHTILLAAALPRSYMQITYVKDLCNGRQGTGLTTTDAHGQTHPTNLPVIVYSDLMSVHVRACSLLSCPVLSYPVLSHTYSVLSFVNLMHALCTVYNIIHQLRAVDGELDRWDMHPLDQVWAWCCKTPLPLAWHPWRPWGERCSVTAFPCQEAFGTTVSLCKFMPQPSINTTSALWIWLMCKCRLIWATTTCSQASSKLYQPIWCSQLITADNCCQWHHSPAARPSPLVMAVHEGLAARLVAPVLLSGAPCCFDCQHSVPLWHGQTARLHVHFTMCHCSQYKHTPCTRYIALTNPSLAAHVENDCTCGKWLYMYIHHAYIYIPLTIVTPHIAVY